MCLLSFVVYGNFFSEMPEKYVLLCFGQLHAEDFFFLFSLFVCL